MAASMDPNAISALYAEPPAGFIAARNELSARLKADGDPEGAKEVAALRKPSAAAWAVNAIARDRALDMETLIRLGKSLFEAQRDVAAEGGLDRLRDVGAERRRLVDRLVREAANTLEGAGMSAARATLDKIANTLMAIATDEDASDRVRRGALDKELPAPAGFGDEALDESLLASVTQLPTTSRASRQGGSGLTPAQQRKEREAARRAERLEADAEALELEAARLEREAKDAAAEASAAARTAGTARRRADAARRRADDADPRR